MSAIALMIIFPTEIIVFIFLNYSWELDTAQKSSNALCFWTDMFAAQKFTLIGIVLYVPQMHIW